MLKDNKRSSIARVYGDLNSLFNKTFTVRERVTGEYTYIHTLTHMCVYKYVQTLYMYIYRESIYIEYIYRVYLYIYSIYI